MDRHQLNGVATFLEMLDSAADRGIALNGASKMYLQVDGEDTDLIVVFENGRYAVESA